MAGRLAVVAGNVNVNEHVSPARGKIDTLCQSFSRRKRGSCIRENEPGNIRGMIDDATLSYLFIYTNLPFLVRDTKGNYSLSRFLNDLLLSLRTRGR